MDAIESGSLSARKLEFAHRDDAELRFDFGDDFAGIASTNGIGFDDTKGTLFHAIFLDY